MKKLERLNSGLFENLKNSNCSFDLSKLLGGENTTVGTGSCEKGTSDRETKTLDNCGGKDDTKQGDDVTNTDCCDNGIAVLNDPASIAYAEVEIASDAYAA